MACELGSSLTGSAAELHRDPAHGLELLAHAIETYWQLAIAPHWPRMRNLLEGDLLHRSRQFAERGPAGLFADLHPEMSWEGRNLHLERRPEEMSRVLTGEGLLLAHGFWLLVTLDVATSVAFAVIVAVGIPRGHDRSGPKPARNGFAIAARDRVLLAALLFLLIGLLLYAQASYALPLALAANGLPASLYGLLITVNGAIVVIFQPLFIAWLSRLPRLPVLGVSMAVVGVGLALTGVASRPWHYVATMVLWSIGEIGMAGFEAALIADLTPEGAHGTYQALYGWTTAVARFAGPAVGAILFQTQALWWACAATGIGCALFALVLMPAVARREPAVA
jgi:hypothetical protein